ncbi:hypothetical protein [Mesorhizobium sp.]|uniref:hypothetical protein n=1 Tax=Mesorhizobium sp. TaxID=1871066 RepID=UPI000FE7249E|nr:hypothetical protein [Mesorhizobium sp.]RWC27772.1 MAG: hypothetical protein EOS27_20540 [Mesorhizobium sp.]TIX25325.1 MAG: hypothetical protein E5V35_14835 [Mesorhizobium sp.]
MGVGLSALFLVWAVPEFRSPVFAKQYYDHWQAAASASQKSNPDDPHFWVRELYGWVYAEDTLAQWLMVLLGFGTAAISLYALIWLRRTWDQTRRSASAAHDANEIAEQTSIAQLRPYVVVDGIDCSFEPASNRVGHDVRVFIRWKNCGQTPTRRMMWDVSYKRTIGSKGLPEGFEYPRSGEDNYTILGPGQTSVDISTTIKFSDYEGTLKGVAELYLWGWVEYSDGFPGSVRHRSEMCVGLLPVIGDDILRPHTHAEHNGADEDCLKQPMTTA